MIDKILSLFRKAKKQGGVTLRAREMGDKNNPREPFPGVRMYRTRPVTGQYIEKVAAMKQRPLSPGIEKNAARAFLAIPERMTVRGRDVHETLRVLPR